MFPLGRSCWLARKTASPAEEAQRASQKGKELELQT